MDKVNIRRATADDFPRVTQLWKEMIDYHSSLDPRFKLSIDSEEKYMGYLYSIHSNLDYAVLVACTKKEIVGYTIGMILNNPPVFDLERYGFIAEMAVDESVQRLGVGHQLWKSVQRWLQRRGIEVIQLNVSPENKRGYAFWQKVGFNPFLHILWHTIPKKI